MYVSISLSSSRLRVGGGINNTNSKKCTVMKAWRSQRFTQGCSAIEEEETTNKIYGS
jgi:hypothetical protein